MPTDDDAQLPTAPGHHQVVIFGAGPAGLTAAYQLTKAGERPVVLEADDMVGGISRTVERDGWRFDIGGHRFFTKVPEVEALWHEILPDEDFLLRPRMSRIFYDGKYYDYPLKASNALRNLGVVEAVRCVASYAWARVRPPDPTSLEGWISGRFGHRLYSHFFKTYNEKLWGVPASQISPDFAAQRIKNLSLSKAVLNSLMPKRNQKDITSLIEEFQYPKYGPGMMWEACRDKVVAAGAELRMRTRVRTVRHRDGRAYQVVAETAGGEEVTLDCTAVVSSMPFPELVRAMDPPVPDDVRQAADDLNFRDFLTVALVVPEAHSFPDNWIYIHSPDVKVGRIQNFGSWSPYLIKEGRTCLGMEYFVFEGDRHWTMDDAELVELASNEIDILGLVPAGRVEAGYVVRMPKAYPVYDEHYQANVEVLRRWIAETVPNVHPVGRNGMHRYNNQDHSMLTAMLSVENILGTATHDIWSVNVEEDYHEEQTSTRRGTGRDAPVIPRQAMAAATEERRRRNTP
ncbi:MAG TPA: NAD(P)/FAD-dependent oxidoreductase [Acidimicrobiales bacterium]|jgi:protoporphyrinogen oxidase|nr:NAD(P)/FAD-dependent oxidoreductase [Acidimicrobiales bacterium]